MFKAEVITEFDSTFLADILLINSKSFPATWIYEDSFNYYKAMMMDKRNIHIILHDNGTRIGYLLAIPHNNAIVDLKEYDPEMKEDNDTYYIETIGILPEFRKKGGSSLLCDALIEECLRRGVHKISMHARTNGFSNFIQSRFNITPIRRIETWKYYNFEEPADYIEISVCSGE